MFTALGETISERAGVLNIGLEGMMLLGAYCGFLGAYYGHSVWLGYLAGIARRHARRRSLMVVALRLARASTRSSSGSRSRSPARGSRACFQGAEFGSTSRASARRRRSRSRCSTGSPCSEASTAALFNQPLLVYLGFAFAGLLGWIFRSTNIGLNLRAAGEKPEALDAAGVSVVATRSYAALATGALAGLGGAYLVDRRRRRSSRRS